jgi:hypothetical protein
MHIESYRDWWKIKVYNEVSEYLKHPSNARKQQLQTVLVEYEQVFKHVTSSETDKYTDMELAMNDC